MKIDSHMPTETELKLLINPADVRRLQRHPSLKTLTRQTFPPQQLLSVYYDTPGLTLHRHAVAVRLRRVGRRWVQTVKTEGRVAAGLHERPEWECETAEGTLDFSAVTDPAVRDFFADEHLRQALRPVFVTEFSRARRLLAFPGGEQVEFALDRGTITAGERQLPLFEVELEMKSGGDPAHLFGFALDLLRTVPLRLENVSKAERGYRLVTQAEPAPVKATTPVLDDTLSAREGFVRIVQSCLTHLQANEHGVTSGGDPEYVHQMRVALRRMRSAFGAFSDVIGKDTAAPIREELRWLTSELDGARNWDVFTLETLPPILAAFPGHEGSRWLGAESDALRRHYDDRARDAVRSQRYQRLLLTLGAWLCTQARPGAPALQTGAPAAPSLLEHAAATLRKRHKQLNKHGQHLAALAPPERHAVRIAAKKLRYAAEFFSPLFVRKRTRGYVGALSQLQDVLGTLNDAATTVSLLQEIPAADDAVRQQAKGVVHGWVEGVSHAKVQALTQAWERFLEQKSFWK